MADTDKPAKSAASTPRWIKALLAGSLALNFAVIAGAIGMAVTFDGPPPPKYGGMFGISGYVRALQEDKRKEFGRTVRDALPQRPSRESFMAQAQATLDLIRAEPFDAAALDAQLSAMAERFEVGRKTGDRVFVQIVEQMTPAERADYADRLEKRIEKGFERNKGKFKPH
ncbi:MAG: periplasmic heavy metal sensor [Donghicola eburneus]|nr:periplasmic heavy metal sensor [Donghicola eburneus]MCI5039371.1 periplasmic heavy metal sensor [Donghicola eburneus]